MIPSKISRLVSIERWWLQGLILKANNKSEETGQKSSDDEVSKLILLDWEREFFWKNKCLNESYLLIEERLYSMCKTVTYLFSNCCYG